MSNSDPLVKKPTIWRNNFYAHRSSDHALDAEAFARKYPLSSPDIEPLLANGVAIVNRYSVLFMATSHSNMVGRDDCPWLRKAVREALDAHETRIQEEIKQFTWNMRLRSTLLLELSLPGLRDLHRLSHC